MLPGLRAARGLILPALFAAGVPCAGQEQPGGAGGAARAISSYDLSGRTFAGLKFPLAPSAGAIELSAQRAWGWTETETVGGAAQSCQRVLLDGDAALKLGTYSFTARRAAVWLAPLPAGDPAAAPDVWQVFIVLDEPNAADAAGAITLSGGRLPVRGVIKVAGGGGVKLKADKLNQGRPADAFVSESERVLAERLRRLIAGPTAPPAVPEELVARGLPVPPIEGPAPDDQSLKVQRRIAEEMERRLGPSAHEEPIFATGGIISFTAGSISLLRAEGDVVLSRGVSITYWEKSRDRTLEVTGERAVIFLEKATEVKEGQATFEAEKVRGFFLEGDVVASDGQHTVRSPRVYYSVKDNRALLVDAVYWTYDQRRQLPLYIRAKSIEQLSTDQFRATDARLSNTPFFEPDLSIGASTVTVTRRPPSGEGGERRVFVDARNITLRAGDVPVFYWPLLRGDPGLIPLRDARIENASGSGVALKTTWNVYSLLGIDAPPDRTAELLVDGYFQRGVALGTNMSWGDPKGPYRGGLFGYFLPEDHGTEILPTGQRSSHQGETRGMFVGEHRVELSDTWSLYAEGAYISDPNFVAGFFEPLARNRREFTNSLYLRAAPPGEDSLFSAEIRGRATDFIPNEYLLQSPGYTVAKYPDISYTRLADDLIGKHPGLLTYSSSYRYTQMRMEFSNPPVSEFGFAAPFRSNALFGIAPNQSIADALRARGLTQEPVNRFDTRHELSMQLAAGPVSITPFVSGRFTIYDDTFQAFSPNADEYDRVWGSEGVTVSTELTHIDNSVESRVLDLHRLRHIIQPSVTVWHADTSVHRADLPVFDDDVESIAEGTATRFALDQTWQTQRGGPGRWRSVDVLKLSTGIVTSTADVDPRSPIGRWFDYRPELSNLGGSFGTVEGSWQVTEVLGLGGETIYNLDTNQQARTALGFTLGHESAFSISGDVRYINPLNQTYANLFTTYNLTPKYTVGASGSYDTVKGEFQQVSLDIRRRFPNATLGVQVGHNSITNVTSFGIIIQPLGAKGAGASLSGLGTPGGAAGFGM